MIRCVVRRIRDLRHRRWLLLGKGPSLARLRDIPRGAYLIFSLNHACLHTGAHRVEVAHFTDLEAWEDCRHAVPWYACLPWHPHRDFRPGRADLAALLRDRGIAEDLVLSYNSTLAHKLARNGSLATITVRHFSAVAGFNILVAGGVREVYSLGVDGGTGYAPGLDVKDRLANGRSSFDAQFLEIDRTCRATGARLIRL